MPSAARQLLQVLAIALVGASITAVCFYPGFLDGDSSYQYMQVETGLYKDKDPVIMAWVWTWLDRVIEGSGGLFLITALIWWAGVGLILSTQLQGVALLVAGTLLVGLFVPNFAMLSQIQKDVGMAAALAFGYGFLFFADQRKSLMGLFIALLGGWYALSVRHNGAAAVAPLAVWAAYLGLRDHAPGKLRSWASRWWAALGLGVALLAVLIGLSSVASERMLGPRGERFDDWLTQAFFISDLAGLSVRTDRSFFPDEFFTPDEPMTIEEIRAIYHPHTAIALHWQTTKAEKQRRFRWEPTPERVRMLRQAWLQAVREEPLTYLKQRTELFLAHLGLLENTPYRSLEFFVWANVDGKKLYYYPYRGPTMFDMPHTRWLVENLAGLSRGMLFKPWPYLLLTLALTATAAIRRPRANVPTLLLGASSIAYLLPYWFIGLSAEFRYLWWCVVVACLQLALACSASPVRSAAADEPVGAT